MSLVLHFDLTSSSLQEQQQQTVERALALGGQHYDVGPRPSRGSNDQNLWMALGEVT